MDKPDKRPLAVFDVPAMFAHAGGYAADMQDMLHDHYGTERIPTVQAIQMWKQRAVIPKRWQPPVIFALLREGHRIEDLMIPRVSA